jgi:CubicO group peptidase (beta-lactamase class C family)
LKRKFSLVLVVGLAIAPAVWARQPSAADYRDSRIFPAGRMGERLRAMIDAINVGSPESIGDFIATQCAARFRDMAPLPEHIDVFLGVHRETGGLDFHGIRSYVPERPGVTVVILKDRNLENWWGINIRFTPAPDFLIDGLGFQSARPPKDINEPALTEAAAVAELRAAIDRLGDKGVFSGAVLLAKGDTVLLRAAAGEASKSFHAPNDVDTKFNLGSMNKMFTSTAVMRLVEKGKIALDDPISRFVDESWLPKSVTEKITIRQLLTHSSGLGSYFNETYMKSSRALFRKLDDYKPLIKDDRPAFEPGTRYQYSNTGMFLLGVVIEKVTGGDYFEHIRKAVYGPAGMANSDCYEMDYPVENLAIGYSPDWESPYGWQNNLYKHVIKGGPAGGGFSTVGDLHKFAVALLSGKLVSPESLKAMWTDQLKANYGYGFALSEDAAGKVAGHAGGFPGINSRLDIYVDKGYIVAVMSNIDGGAEPVANKIGRLLTRVR